jgi:hypothetical protein
MSFRRSLCVVACVILACTAFLPAARANEWNQATKIEFSEPIEIPNAVLAPGTYWFVLYNSKGNRNIVQIFNSDWSKLYATEVTVPTTRKESTTRTEIKFAERPHSQPEALWQWYYPGRLTGHEFLYPTKQETQLTLDAKQDVVARPLNGLSNIATPGA